MPKRLTAARAVALCAAAIGALGILVDVAAGPLPPVTGLFAYASLFDAGASHEAARPSHSVCPATWPVPGLAARASGHDQSDANTSLAILIPAVCSPTPIFPSWLRYGPLRSAPADRLHTLHRLRC